MERGLNSGSLALAGVQGSHMDRDHQSAKGLVQYWGRRLQRALSQHGHVTSKPGRVTWCDGKAFANGTCRISLCLL